MWNKGSIGKHLLLLSHNIDIGHFMGWGVERCCRLWILYDLTWNVVLYPNVVMHYYFALGEWEETAGSLFWVLWVLDVYLPLLHYNVLIPDLLRCIHFGDEAKLMVWGFGGIITIYYEISHEFLFLGFRML